MYYHGITVLKLDFLCCGNVACRKSRRKGKVLWNNIFCLFKSTKDHFERPQSLDFSWKRLHERGIIDHLTVELRGRFLSALPPGLEMFCLSLFFSSLFFYLILQMHHSWQSIGVSHSSQNWKKILSLFPMCHTPTRCLKRAVWKGGHPEAHWWPNPALGTSCLLAFPSCSSTKDGASTESYIPWAFQIHLMKKGYFLYSVLWTLFLFPHLINIGV